MKKIIFIIFAVALASCSTEEIVEPIDNNDDTTPPVEVSKFTGDFKLDRILVGAPQAGEVISDTTFDCPSTWIFRSDFVIRKYRYELRGEDCVSDGTQQDNFYTTPDDSTILIGLDQTVYKISRQDDYIILTTTSTSVDEETDYFLRRI